MIPDGVHRPVLDHADGHVCHGVADEQVLRLPHEPSGAIVEPPSRCPTAAASPVLLRLTMLHARYPLYSIQL